MAKKIKRLLLNVDEDMDKEVRTLAEQSFRNLKDQIRYLIAKGIHHGRTCEINETPRKPPLLSATKVKKRKLA